MSKLSKSMKNILLLCALVFLGYTNVKSQCTDLFISEYVEGWNNNKALELYNPTNASINMSGYSLNRYSNGGTTPSSVNLGGYIGAHSAYVVVIDKTDPSLTGQDTSAWEDLILKADTFLCPDYTVSSAMYFNGNDAVTLEKGGAIIDIFGKVGEDPGSSWTDVYPYTDAQGEYWTKDQTLIRKRTVEQGITANPSYFNPTSEWDSLPANAFDSLGYHTCDCYTGSAKVKDVKVIYNDNAYFFPNPSLIGKKISVKGTSVIQYVEIYTQTGEMVYRKWNDNNRGEMQLELNGISSSVYFVRVVFDNKHSIIKELSIN